MGKTRQTGNLVSGNILFSDITNNRIGIGTSIPNGTLEVGAVSGAVTAGDLTVTTGSTTATVTLGRLSSTGSDNTIFNIRNRVGTSVLYMNSGDGQLGINTATPGALLDVTGSNGKLLIANGTASNSMRFSAQNATGTGNAAMVFESWNLEYGRFDTSGRLLVGTASFTGEASLAIKASSAGSGTQAKLILQRGQANPAPDLTLGEILFGDSDASGHIGAAIAAQVDGGSSWGSGDYPSRLVFSTTADGASSPTERMRIASDGRLTCDLNNAGFYLLGLGSAAGTNALRWSSSTGLVTADTSSRLVKTDVSDCPYGINELKLLRPRKYFRTDDSRHEIGFIADEVIDVMPEFVPVGAKSVITGNKNDKELIPVGVNYEKLTAVLTAALQEAIAKIETLEAKVAALEGA